MAPGRYLLALAASGGDPMPRIRAHGIPEAGVSFVVHEDHLGIVREPPLAETQVACRSREPP
jgi:hypothetical protein